MHHGQRGHCPLLSGGVALAVPLPVPVGRAVERQLSACREPLLPSAVHPFPDAGPGGCHRRGCRCRDGDVTDLVSAHIHDSSQSPSRLQLLPPTPTLPSCSPPPSSGEVDLETPPRLRSGSGRAAAFSSPGLRWVQPPGASGGGRESQGDARLRASTQLLLLPSHHPRQAAQALLPPLPFSLAHTHRGKAVSYLCIHI